MRFPSREIVESIRKEYPVGTRVELVHMDDFQAPPIGTRGTVRGVDDTGSIMVAWDNGCGLNVVYGEDRCRKVAAMNNKIKEQILTIRSTGLTNMFDIHCVQRIAHEMNFYDLVVFIEEHRSEYVHFIMHGEN
jgi:hypothetical protein